VLPTPIEAMNIIQPDSDADSQSSVSDGAEGHQLVEVSHWPGIPCPFAGCGLRIPSYPGLVMHPKCVHGAPLPGKQRRAIATVYRARRLDADRAANMSTAVATTLPQTASSMVVSALVTCCPAHALSYGVQMSPLHSLLSPSPALPCLVSSFMNV